MRRARASVSATLCQSLIIRLVPSPIPRTMRPSKSSSKSRVSVANTRGLRPTPDMIDDPIRQLRVAWATAAMDTVAEPP